MKNCLRSLIGWINSDRDLTEMREPYLKLHLASLITQTFKLLDLLLFYNSKKPDTNYQHQPSSFCGSTINNNNRDRLSNVD